MNIGVDLRAKGAPHLYLDGVAICLFIQMARCWCCPDSARAREWEADQGDCAASAVVAQSGAQGDPGHRGCIRLSLHGSPPPRLGPFQEDLIRR